MNQNNLVPLSTLANRYGVKAIGYGPPGSSKTPLMLSAPAPVCLITEPGILSVRGSPIAARIPAFVATTKAQIGEFATWVTTSAEAKKFDTICTDSVSEMAEIVLREEKARNKDPRKAYGEMFDFIYGILQSFYHIADKHVYLIAKQTEDALDGTKKPYFPGQALNTAVPHLYDLIMQVSKRQFLPDPTMYPVLQCLPTHGVHARDRSGKLSEIEAPDLGALFKKVMS